MSYTLIDKKKILAFQEASLAKFFVKKILENLASKRITQNNFEHKLYEQETILFDSYYSPKYKTKDLFDLLKFTDNSSWVEDGEVESIHLDLYVPRLAYNFLELEIHFNNKGDVLVNIRSRDKGEKEEQELLQKKVDDVGEFLEKFIYECCLETLISIRGDGSMNNKNHQNKSVKKDNHKPEKKQFKQEIKNSTGVKKMNNFNTKNVTFGFIIVLVIWDVLTTYYGTYQVFTLGGKSNTDNGVIHFVSGLFAVGIIIFILSYRVIFRANNKLIKGLLVVIFIYDFITSFYGTGQAINMDYRNFAQWAIVLLLSVMTTSAPILMSYLKDEGKI